MDLIMVLLAVIIIGAYRGVATGGFIESRPPELCDDGTVRYFNVDDIPVGNNLMLKREVAPYMRIVKQLGLVK